MSAWVDVPVPGGTARFLWAEEGILMVVVDAGEDGGPAGFPGGSLLVSTLAGTAIGRVRLLPPVSPGCTWVESVGEGADLPALWVEIDVAGARCAKVMTSPVHPDSPLLFPPWLPS